MKLIELVIIGTVISLVSINSAAVCAERVNDGILVLYTFEEDRGDVAHDVSGVGSTLDLYISGSMNRWLKIRNTDGVINEI